MWYQHLGREAVLVQVRFLVFLLFQTLCDRITPEVQDASYPISATLLTVSYCWLIITGSICTLRLGRALVLGRSSGKGSLRSPTTSAGCPRAPWRAEGG